MTAAEGRKPTQAERLRKAEQDLAEVTVNLSVLAAALLTVAERNGTSGWGTVASVVTVMREGSEHARAMARAGDLVVGRVSPDSAGARFMDHAVRIARRPAPGPRRLSAVK